MGHCTPSAATETAPPVMPPPAAAFSGPEHAADPVYGAHSMAEAREVLRREHGDLPAYKVFFDRIETRVRDGRDSYLVEGQAWYGGDIDKVWLKTEVEGEWGEGVEGAEVQGLWSHAIDPWFDLQAGVRYDVRRGPDRGHLVLGIQGLAPYWWEVDGAVFLSNKGEITARAEAEYDLRITQKLILQPRVEIDLSLQGIPKLQIGAGLTSASIGARLRYQVTPLFSPYVGVEYERAFGDTRRFLREDGDDPGGFNLLAGVRIWF
jgi:copper resistance protein B